MSENKLLSFVKPEDSSLSLDAIARRGAQEMIRVALEMELDQYLGRMQDLKTEEGKAGIVRNGYHKERKIATSGGVVEVKVPRTRNRVGTDEKFVSALVPPFMRRSLQLDEAIPLLYLKGISTNDMEESLEKLFGDTISGLSATNVSRLKKAWQGEYEEWIAQDLSEKEYCYLYADGIHVKVRFGEKKLCLLVLIGVLKSGKKELVGVTSGYRESEDSWREFLISLKSRGLVAPTLAIGDGALGFWKAMQGIFPETKWQRCTVHKKANIIAKLPKSLHKEAGRLYNDIIMAEKRVDAEKAFEAFVKRFEITQPRAVDCLKKDKEALLEFYSFPKLHWKHIRTTNPIESTFATVRLRTASTRGQGTEETTFMMVFKLLQGAEKRWQRIFGSAEIPFVMSGQKYQDGDRVEKVV